MDKTIGCVASRDQLLKLLVVCSVSFSILDHSLDLFIRQATGGLDDNRLLLARCLVLGGHVQDAVGIQVECHFDLRHTTRRRWNVGQVETTQRLVLCSLLALTLYHMNGDGGLVVVGSRENLRLLGRNRGV